VASFGRHSSTLPGQDWLLPAYKAHGCGRLQEEKMKALAMAAVLALAAGSAHAASCKVEASNKKLAGAAMTSFMGKCEKDAKAACDKSAADKKLSGAAKDSHIKKCVADSVGS
jgi:hypothetical protein